MLMAAGLGTRLRPFTDVLPKPVLPLLGVPMAQYALDAMARAGVGRVVANVHPMAGRVAASLRALERGSMELEISDESKLLLGSGGGIRQALPLLGGGPFLLMNADTVCDVDLGALLARHRELRARDGVLLTLAVFGKAPGAGTYTEIGLDAGGEKITGLGARERGRPFFVGIAVIEPEAVMGLQAGLPGEFVPGILRPAIEAGRAGAFVTSGLWYDVGSPELWLETHVALLEGLEKPGFPAIWRERIEKGSRRVGERAWVGRSAKVEGASMQGPCYLGAGAAGALGPRAVVYGKVPALARDGIGYGGHWVGVATGVGA